MTFSIYDLKTLQTCKASFLNSKFQENDFTKVMKLYKKIAFGFINSTKYKIEFSRDFSAEIEEFGAEVVMKVNENLENVDPTSFIDSNLIQGIGQKVALVDGNLTVNTTLDIWGERNTETKTELAVFKFAFSNAVRKDKTFSTLVLAIATVIAKNKKSLNSLDFQDFPDFVNVYNVSVVNISAAIHSYSRNELFSGIEILKAVMKQAEEVKTAKTEATHTAGKHCLTCSHRDMCSLAQNQAVSIEDKLNKALYLEQEVKALKDQVKQYAEEVQNKNLKNLILNKPLEIPLAQGKIGVFVFKSTNKIVRSRKKEAPTDLEILNFLFENGDLTNEEDNISKNIKISMTPDFKKHLTKENPEWVNYFKETVQNTISINTK